MKRLTKRNAETKIRKHCATAACWAMRERTRKKHPTVRKTIINDCHGHLFDAFSRHWIPINRIEYAFSTTKSSTSAFSTPLSRRVLRECMMWHAFEWDTCM